VNTPEFRRQEAEWIAVIFDVPLHLISNDLPAGYWERELRREIGRRSIRHRLRRLWRWFT
jgi:hypothetical protein